jgi:hypothetical protein
VQEIPLRNPTPAEGGLGVANGRDTGEVGMLPHRAVGLLTEHPARLHGDDEEAPVRQPAQATRPVVDLELDGSRALGVERRDRMLEEVGEPQAAVVPARAFTEVDTVDEHGESGHERSLRPF